MVFGLVVVMTVFWNLLSAMAMGLAVAFFRFVKDQSDRYKADLSLRDEDVKQEEEDLIFSFARDRARQISQNGAHMGEISGRFENIVSSSHYHRSPSRAFIFRCNRLAE